MSAPAAPKAVAIPPPRPLDAPVTMATLLDSLLMFTILAGPTSRTPNVQRCELRLARIKISIHCLAHEVVTGHSSQHTSRDGDGLIWMPEEGFKNAFAQHATAEQIAVTAAVQRPISLKCIQEPVARPAWRYKPSWFLIAEDD